MNKFLPPKPEFTSNKRSDGTTEYPWIFRWEFDVWYDREVVPLFENAVEVQGTKTSNMGWSMSEGNNGNPTHTALLINITSIKTETAEDLLKAQCEKLANSLNKIAILQMGELDYTKDFYEEVKIITRTTLAEYEAWKNGQA